jgi:hypothetical protein
MPDFGPTGWKEIPEATVDQLAALYDGRKPNFDLPEHELSREEKVARRG